jgi:hypothetical protein
MCKTDESLFFVHEDTAGVDVFVREVPFIFLSCPSPSPAGMVPVVISPGSWVTTWQSSSRRTTEELSSIVQWTRGFGLMQFQVISSLWQKTPLWWGQLYLWQRGHGIGDCSDLLRSGLGLCIWRKEAAVRRGGTRKDKVITTCYDT